MNVIDWNIVATNWKQFRGTVRARWGKFSDEHLDLIAGKRELLVSKIQQLYDLKKADAEREVSAFEERHKDYRPKKVA